MDYKISSYTLSSTLGGIDSLNEIEEDIEEVRIATREDFLQKEELKHYSKLMKKNIKQKLEKSITTIIYLKSTVYNKRVR